jgi:hypothetical protein
MTHDAKPRPRMQTQESLSQHNRPVIWMLIVAVLWYASPLLFGMAEQRYHSDSPRPPVGVRHE